MRYPLVLVIVFSSLHSGSAMADEPAAAGHTSPGQTSPGSNPVTPQPQPQPQPPTVPPKLTDLLDRGAEDSFRNGQRAFESGDYDRALTHWLDAYRLVEEPWMLEHIAQAYRALGEYAKARRVLALYARLALTSKQKQAAITERGRLESCTRDTASAESVSIRVSRSIFVSGDAQHRIELVNPTARALKLTEILTPELRKLGIDTRYVGDRLLKPFSTVEGYVSFPAKPAQKLKSVTITAVLGSIPMDTTRPSLTVHATVTPVIWVVPDDRIRQLSVSVHGVYGAFFAGTGVDGSTITEFTDLRGVTVGVQKGMSDLLAIDVGITFAGTGHATFENITVNGMTGALSRRARLGRLIGSGVLRTGKENILSARISFGLQVASYDSSLSTPTGEVTGPGDGVAFDMLIGGGMGYTRRLGEHWSLGVSGRFGGTFTEAQTLEAGMHMAYGWNP